MKALWVCLSRIVVCAGIAWPLAWAAEPDSPPAEPAEAPAAKEEAATKTESPTRDAEGAAESTPREPAESVEPPAVEPAPEGVAPAAVESEAPQPGDQGAEPAEQGAPPDARPEIRTETPPAAEPAQAEAGEAAAAEPDAPAGGAGLRLNFQAAPLSDVLNYLSEAAGFVVVQEIPVSGTVKVVSHQPLSPDEAVDLLNTILADKGYAVLRNGRILKIVDRKSAYRRDLPVRTARRPDEIPRTDEMVTQIIPVRFTDVRQLIQNLTPLLAEDAKLTANESSNAIVLTDTQTNVRRMAEIIAALDTSISDISAVRVFQLRYSDAAELAKVVRELFAAQQAAGPARAEPDFRRFFMRGRGGQGEGGAAAAGGQSAARQAATRVAATSDERSNSLIVCAPDDLMATIAQLVAEIDTDVAEITDVRVFRLENADAAELGQVITDLYADDTSAAATQQGRRDGRQAQRPAASTQSGRQQRQGRVVTVSDPRTNCLLVNAAREAMLQIEDLVRRLDSGEERKQRVYVYPLRHADVENVAAILRGMFGGQTTGARSGTSQTGTGVSRLGERATAGASSEAGGSQGERRTR